MLSELLLEVRGHRKLELPVRIQYVAQIHLSFWRCRFLHQFYSGALMKHPNTAPDCGPSCGWNTTSQYLVIGVQWKDLSAFHYRRGLSGSRGSRLNTAGRFLLYTLTSYNLVWWRCGVCNSSEMTTKNTKPTWLICLWVHWYALTSSVLLQFWKEVVEDAEVRELIWDKGSPAQGTVNTLGVKISRKQ